MVLCQWFIGLRVRFIGLYIRTVLLVVVVKAINRQTDRQTGPYLHVIIIQLVEVFVDGVSAYMIPD